jgi:hypothetical protein
MKPQEQTRKEKNGDCLRACIATLLEVNIEKVPDFALIEDDPALEFPGFWIALQGWLREKGLWFLEMQLPANVPWMPLPYDGLCILFGETKNKIKHAVVGKVIGAEFVLVFNPWPEAEFEGIGALGFIIPRDPAYYVRMGRALTRTERLAKGIFGPVAASIVTTAQEALGENGPALFNPNGTRS